LALLILLLHSYPSATPWSGATATF